MKRAKFDEAAQLALTDCVQKIETTTDAELVLTVRARSGSYRHADFLFGALLAFAGLLFLIFSPFDFHAYWVAIDVALLFVRRVAFIAQQRYSSNTDDEENFAAKLCARTLPRCFMKRASQIPLPKWACWFIYRFSNAGSN